MSSAILNREKMMKGKEKYYILISDKTKLGSDHVGFIPNPGKEGVEVLAIFRKMNYLFFSGS